MFDLIERGHPARTFDHPNNINLLNYRPQSVKSRWQKFATLEFGGDRPIQFVAVNERKPNVEPLPHPYRRQECLHLRVTKLRDFVASLCLDDRLQSGPPD